MKKIFYTLLICFLITPKAFGISLIQDTEIETILNQHLKNIFKATDLNPDNARIALINNDSLNAFVLGGQTVYIHTGLILQSTSIDDVLFVLSHETGHLVAGPVATGKVMYDKMQSSALISSILGGLIAIASPEAGMAIMMGAPYSAANLYASYQQTQESTADRIAVDIMQKNQYSMQGFDNIMKTIQQNERLNAIPQGSYLQTHPITQDRISALDRFLINAAPARYDINFEMIKAKLAGFLYPPEKTIDLYKNKDFPIKAYAYAIANFKALNLEKALYYIDELIKSQPKNPYFIELKAQFLLETGHISQAVKNYEKAVSLMPQAPLMHLALAQALLEENTPQSAQKAITHLKKTIQLDKSIPVAWRFLATAYERLNQPHDIYYPMAEYYTLYNNQKLALKNAKKALQYLTPNTPEHQKAKDIIALYSKHKKAIETAKPR